MNDRCAAFCAHLSLIRVVSPANRAFNRELDNCFLMAPIAPRAACSAIGHIFPFPTRSLKTDLGGRRLRSARSFGGTRGCRLVVQALRLERNLDLRATGGHTCCLSCSLLGGREVSTALLARIIDRLVKSATLEAFDDGHACCWSKAHSYSLHKNRCLASGGRGTGIDGSSMDQTTTARARTPRSAGSLRRASSSRREDRTSCRRPGSDARMSGACPFRHARRTCRTAR